MKKRNNKQLSISAADKFSYEYARLKPFLEHAYLLNSKELKVLEGKTDIEDKVGYLQRVLFMDRGIIHPFTDFEFNEPEDVGTKFLKELMNPDNFPYTCKLLFNIDLMPFQHIILKELWTRPFPMLIGGRGLGKCVKGDTFIQLDNKYTRIDKLINDNTILDKQFLNNVYIYGENGYNLVEYGWCNGKTKTKKITTRSGIILEGTLNHPIRVVNNEKIIWKNLEDISKNDYIPIDRSETWIKETNDLPEDLAYLFGVLVGDGGYTKRGNITITTADKQLIKKCNTIAIKYFNKSFKKQAKKYTYLLSSVDIWNRLFTEYGFNSFVCGEKDFPSTILGASKESCAAFISGLMDTDGSANANGLSIEYCSKSENLVDTLKYILLKFGIVAFKKRKLNKKYNTYYYYLYLNGTNVDLFKNKIGFKLSRKQNRLKTTKRNTNVDIIPHDLVLDSLLSLSNKYKKRDISNYKLKKYQITYTKLKNILDLTKNFADEPEWIFLNDIYVKNYYYDVVSSIEDSECVTYDVHVPKDHSFISNGIISHNSWILGLYTMLRLLFTQGSKVAVVGGSFRQAKGIFEYMERFWYSGHIYRDIVGTSTNNSGKHQGPHHSPERWDMVVGDSMAIALPLGDGCLSPLTPITYVNGFGTISEHATTIANTIFKRRRHVWGNGKFRLSDEAYNNGIQNTKKITTKRGYSFEGTNNHKMKVVVDDKIVWKRSDEMVIGDRILIDRSQRWHKGIIKATEDECYALGAMIGNGCWTNKYRLGFSTQDEYVINRLKKIYNFKQQTDKMHWNYYGIDNVIDWLDKWDLNIVHVVDKTLPHTILCAEQNLMTTCLQGLFDTDGGVQVAKDKRGGYSVSVSFWSVSEKLIDQIHYILLHYGIISTKDSRQRDNKNWNKEFSIRITGKDVKLFAEKIGFASPKKQNVLLDGINKQSKNISIHDTIPVNIVKLIDNAKNNWNNSLKNYKVSGQRLSEIKNITFDKLGEYLKNYPKNDYTLSLLNLYNKNIYYDEIVSIENSRCKTYDIHVPDEHEYCAGGFFSHNSKIRGQRAQYLLADELASINEQIFDDTVFGFAAVSSAPADKVKDVGSANLLKATGLWSNELQTEIDKKYKGNQVVLSGTADYTFGHFYKTYKLYKTVITCKNNESKLKEELGEKYNTGLRAEDCVILRLPSSILPEGFMDKKIIAVAKAKLPSEVYQKEYDATFPNDSSGFYKMSLLLACTCPIKTQEDDIVFEPMLIGSPNHKYVLAIDPASEQDKLAITIIECRGNHRRIVYCWSTKKSQHLQLIAKGLVKEHDYFRYAADKIRELMTRFNIVEIACDAGGGGYSIREALGSPRIEGQLPIYELKDPPDTKNPKMTDEMQGLHILNMIQFSNAKWVSEANYGLKLDLEQKTLIFPFYDLVSEELSLLEDKRQGRVVYDDKSGEEVRLFDSIISNHEEIQELKKELASIAHSKTAAGREKWDLPKHKGPDGKVITETKDRYSSLLMCNSVARNIMSIDALPPKEQIAVYGGRVQDFTIQAAKDDGRMYINQPSWVKDCDGWGVVRRK